MRRIRLLTLSLIATCAVACPLAHAEDSAGSSGSLFDNKPLFENESQSLFSDALFSNQSVSDALHQNVQGPAPQAPTPQQIATRAAGAVNRQINSELVVNEMRAQMKKVADYLYQWSLWNHSHFPAITNNDTTNQVQAQIMELLWNNPFAPGNTQAVGAYGVAAEYNPNGSPQTGSVIWKDDWTAHLGAEQNSRINLVMDYGMTPQEVDQWTTDPPQEWEAQPGMITAIGNNEGFFIVWGAGADGKPIKNLFNGRTLIISGTSSGNTQDRIAPNEI